MRNKIIDDFGTICIIVYAVVVIWASQSVLWKYLGIEKSRETPNISGKTVVVHFRRINGWYAEAGARVSPSGHTYNHPSSPTVQLTLPEVGSLKSWTAQEFLQGLLSKR